MAEWGLECAGEGGDPTVTEWHFLPLILSRSQVRSLLACPQVTALERLALRTLYASGMRGGELVGLKGADVGDGTVAIGGDFPRTVQVDQTTAQELKALCRGREEALFAMTAGELDLLVARAAEAVGLGVVFTAAGRVIQAKTLRHACATHCLENGMDLFVLHKLLGFKYFNTAVMYVEPAIARWWAGYAGYHPLMKGQVAPGCEKPPPAAIENPQRVALMATDDFRGGNEQAHITIEETFQLMEAARNFDDGVRDYLLLRFFYSTALRDGEVEALRFLDLDYEECRVFVRAGKDSIDRYTLMDPETARLLQALQGQRGLGDSVFGIGVRQMQNIVKNAGQVTGILQKYNALGQSLSPHSFRHAHGNHCYEAGIDLFVLKKLVGHAGLEMTLNYVECGLARQKLVYGKMHELARRP